jgi:EAL domain-containing protein (putative c-di-GMP-specific phosphodiesterase class I)
VPADKFIRIAENSGLIIPIGEWVAQNSPFSTRKWQEEGLPNMTAAIHVSAVQFRQEGFCELTNSSEVCFMRLTSPRNVLNWK